MKRLLVQLLAAGALLATGPVASAAPLLPTPATNLYCTVDRWVWRGPIVYAQDESGGHTFTRDYPAHYLLLVTAERVDTNLLAAISSICLSMTFQHLLLQTKLEPNQGFILLQSPRLKEIRDGVRLELAGYSIGGDEFTTFARCQSLLINGAKPTPGRWPITEQQWRREQLDVLEPEKKTRQQPPAGDVLKAAPEE